ncbi:DNA/RNA non-specific endonuclease [Longimicrobium sp.]|uniref:DNA/RNA non-specific endonuclease n=1 Tax=Longimicrobium sp. TaxID=2029185 RepID=UPI002BF8695A|nr:DNA/RNA non-specific endonuclease [Longimicrobium sp.]HSU17623.1 DNA/RNA non-specific endonuclease [Longimicrobium sp.]
MRPTTIRVALTAALGLVIAACADTGTELVAPATPRLDVVSSTGIMITEVMPDPSKVGDTAGEWFEVYNGGTAAVDLQGYKIVSAAGLTASESHTIASSVVVDPGEYVVFGNNANTATNGGVPVAYSYGSSITLNNGSSSSANEWLALRTPGNVTLDSVAYATRVLPAAPGPYSPPTGASRGVIDLTADNTIIGGSNWSTSVSTYGLGDKGTPGQPNQGGSPVSVSVRISWVTPGTTFKVTASAVDSVGKPAATNFTWSSDNTSIATVDANSGVATGVSTGVAHLTATASNGVTGTAPLFVVNPGDVASISISINDPAQVPAGYTKPAFPTTRTTTSATVTPALVWSSSDPAVATVDSLGYITGVSAGSANIRATAPDGVYGEVPFTVIPATAPTSAIYRNHLEFGAPTGVPAGEIVLSKAQYVSGYNPARGEPDWVSWNLNASQFSGVPRCDCFSADQTLPADVYHVVDFDYRNGGYDRGHMVQSESRTTTDQENATTFLLTNIIPQGAENNQGPWSQFENYLNDLARTSGKEIYVVAGGEYAATPGTLKNEGKVAIPDYTWKVAVIMDGGEGLADVHSAADLQVIAVKMPNLTTPGVPQSSVGIRNVPWQNFQVTVHQLEQETGYDFLSKLPKQIQILVETGDHAPVAATDGPYTGMEGSAVTLDAGASSDADGDALTYAWDFGDGTTGTGVKPSHTYADNGNYIVTLTVTDVHGAEATATTAVTVFNVAPAVAAFAGGSLLPHETYTAAGSFTDPGADTWTATVNYGDGAGAQPLALSGQSFSLSHTYAAAGTFTVTVTVTDDDGAVSTKTATVTVLSAQQAIANLQAQVNGAMGGAAASANAKLRAAGASLARGEIDAARGQLGAFINEVQAAVQSGRLSQAQGDALVAAAQRILDSIGA